MVSVLFFAAAREHAGTEGVELELAGVSVKDACDRLLIEYPALAKIMGQCRCALNGEFVDADVLIGEGDEFVLIPPVAGGDHLIEDRVQILDSPLSVDDALDAVVHDAAGAQVVMIGTVRNHAQGKGVESLEYEAYGAMAKKVITKIVAEVEDEFQKAKACVFHRTGHLAIGDRAVVVAVSHPHRKEAFEACQKIIDRLKEDAPIWKREHREGGVLWVGLGP